MKRYATAVGLALAWGSLSVTGAHAQDASEIDLESLLNVEVSSASKFSQRVADAPSAVTVVTAEDIRRMGAVSLPEALRMVPGLNLRAKSRGSYGVSIRNDTRLTAPRILILVDGRQATNELGGLAMWEMLEVTLDQVDRIEVVRGPGSTLYGAGAYDGVISIFTRRPAGGAAADASASVGELGEHIVSAGYRQSIGALRVEGAAETRASSPARPLLLPDATTLEETDSFLRGNARVGWSNADGVDVELSAGASDGESLTYWAYGTDFQLSALQSSFVHLAYTHPNLVSGFSLSSRAYRNARTMGTVFGAMEDRTQGAEVVLDGALGGGHRLVSGAVVKRIWSNRSYTSSEPGHDLLYAAFVQDSWTITPRWELVAGVRYDRAPAGEADLSPRGTLLFKPSLRHTLRASAGRAYRHPITLERGVSYLVPLGSGASYPVFGNPELESEVITSYEAGYIGSPAAWLTLTADLFYNQHGGHIDLSPLDGGGHGGHEGHGGGGGATGFRYENLHPGQAVGGELGAAVLPAEWIRAKASYAYLSLAHEEMGADGDVGGWSPFGGMAMTTAPAHKVNAEVAVRPIAPLSVNLTYQFVGETDYAMEMGPGLVTRYGYASLPALSLLHLNTRVQIRRGLTGSVFVQNLLGGGYRDVIGGEEFGRRILARLSYQF